MEKCYRCLTGDVCSECESCDWCSPEVDRCSTCRGEFSEWFFEAAEYWGEELLRA